MPIYTLEKMGKVKTPRISPTAWISEYAVIIGNVIIVLETIVN